MLRKAKDSLRFERFWIKNKVPVIAVWNDRKKGKRPLVIQCHGARACKENHFWRSLDFANMGCFAVAFDAYGHGERKKPAAGSPHSGPEMFLRQIASSVRDIGAIIGWAVQRNEVDPKRIAIIGYSMGGMNALAALKVYPEINLAAIMVSTGDFIGRIEERLKREKRFKIKGVRAILKKLARHSVHTDMDKFAKRPIIFCAGAKDKSIPPKFTRRTYRCLLKEYKKTGMEAALQLNIYPRTGHASTEEMHWDVFKFFAKYFRLKVPKRICVNL